MREMEYICKRSVSAVAIPQSPPTSSASPAPVSAPVVSAIDLTCDSPTSSADADMHEHAYEQEHESGTGSRCVKMELEGEKEVTDSARDCMRNTKADRARTHTGMCKQEEEKTALEDGPGTKKAKHQ